MVVRTATGCVRADPVRLRYVIGALLDNALKWSPADSPIEVDVAPTNDDVTVRVTDHGAGIPADRQSRIFECFFRAHAGTTGDVGGMGIGLHLSRRFLEQMEGSIGFTSTEGRGSAFFFTLPRVQPRATS
jgi:signal transduction histidine kinase